MITGIELKIKTDPEDVVFDRPDGPAEDHAAQMAEQVVGHLHEHFEEELEYIRITDTEQAMGTGLPVTGPITGELIDTTSRLLNNFLAHMISIEQE